MNDLKHTLSLMHGGLKYTGSFRYLLHRTAKVVCTVLFLCFALAGYTQVSDKEFEDFKEKTEEQLESIKEKVENSGKTTKDYIDSTDKLSDRFFGMVDILYGVAGLLLGGLIVATFQFLQEKYKLKKEREHEQFVKKQDEKYEALQKQLDRLAKREEKTIYIEENTVFLFIHKDENAQSYARLSEFHGLLREYRNKAATYFTHLEDWKNDSTFKTFMGNSSRLKVVIMSDDLFDDLSENGNFTAEGKKQVMSFMAELKYKKVGFFNLGGTRFPKENKPTYIAFANELYSAYVNMNNLLKFIMTAEDIRP